MLIDIRTGERGCDYCHGHIMTTIESPAGLTELCWDHTKQFTGWSSEQLEAAHASFEDHILDAFQRGVDADKEDLKRWLGIG